MELFKAKMKLKNGDIRVSRKKWINVLRKEKDNDKKFDLITLLVSKIS